METDRQVSVAGQWAVATDGVQWVLQKRAGAGWRPVSHVRSTKNVLARCMREKGVEPEIADKLLASLRDYGDEAFADGVIPDVHQYRHRRDFRSKPSGDACSPSKPPHAAETPFVVGPVENYSPRSLRAARMPLHPDTIAYLRETNNWERIREETAWGRRRTHVPDVWPPGAVLSDWKPCLPGDWESLPDLAMPDFLRR